MKNCEIVFSADSLSVISSLMFISMRGFVRFQIRAR